MKRKWRSRPTSGEEFLSEAAASTVSCFERTNLFSVCTGSMGKWLVSGDRGSGCTLFGSVNPVGAAARRAESDSGNGSQTSLCAVRKWERERKRAVGCGVMAL